MIGKLRPGHQLRVCYEAGPTGYVLYWQLTALGVNCQVVAPALVLTKAGDRVKTDRRDAEKLARCHRAGDLTAVWVPDEAHEALRDLIRAREAAKTDQQRLTPAERGFDEGISLKPVMLTSGVSSWNPPGRIDTAHGLVANYGEDSNTCLMTSRR